MEIISAYIQYYRETANYLERTSSWIERIGLDHVKEALQDVGVRKELTAKLEQSLTRYMEPWKEAYDNQQILEKYFKTEEIHEVLF